MLRVRENQVCELALGGGLKNMKNRKYPNTVRETFWSESSENSRAQDINFASQGPRITLHTMSDGKELLDFQEPFRGKRNTTAIRARVNQEAVAVSLSSLSRRSLYSVVRLILRISAALALLPPARSTTFS